MNAANPARRSLEDRLDAPAPAWRPEPGDRLIGIVVDVGTREGTYGPYPVVTVESEEDGCDLAFHGFHSVARQELARLKVRVGDRIGLAYHGRRTSKGGDEYESYVIRVDREEPVEPAAPARQRGLQHGCRPHCAARAGARPASRGRDRARAARALRPGRRQPRLRSTTSPLAAFASRSGST